LSLQLLPPTCPLKQKHWNVLSQGAGPPVQSSPGCGLLPQSAVFVAPPNPLLPPVLAVEQLTVLVKQKQFGFSEQVPL
jgi:hypothetical protein